MLSILFQYVVWFILPLIAIFFIIRHITKKKRNKIEVILFCMMIGLISISFLQHLFSSPSLFERIEEYHETMNLNNSEISKITFFKDARHGNFSKKYVIENKKKIDEINSILKLNEFALSEGNLNGIKYWKVSIETKSSKIFYYNIMDTHKGLFITLFLNKKGIGDYKNNYLKIILDDIEKYDKSK